MSTDFIVAAKSNPSKYVDNVSKGDAVTYTFDFSAWQEDNSAIESVTWFVEGGQISSISGEDLTDGVASALVTFTDEGTSVISVTAVSEDGEQKKVWLEVRAHDQQLSFSDYWDTP